MTIKEFSTAHGITPAAVYNRLRKRGIPTKSVIEADNITAEGMAILSELYPDAVAEDPKPDQSARGEQLFVMEAKLEALEEKCRIFEARCVDLEKERDAWREAAAVAARMAEREQAERLLPPPAPEPKSERRGLLSWLKR